MTRLAGTIAPARSLHWIAAAALVWERDFSLGTLVARAWAIDYGARRAAAGGGFAPAHGAAASTNTIERQQFTTYGARRACA